MSLNSSSYEHFLFDAKRGDPTAQWMMVCHHSDNQSDPYDPPVDINEGKIWGKKLIESAENGNYIAKSIIVSHGGRSNIVPMLFPNTSVENILNIQNRYKKQIEEGAEKKIPDAMYALAYIARDGNNFNLMKTAAEAGSSLACKELASGYFYALGYVAEKDLTLAEYYAAMGSKYPDTYACRCMGYLAMIRYERQNWSDTTPEYLDLLKKAANAGDYSSITELLRIERLEELSKEFSEGAAPRNTSSNNSGGCYIATAVYGSYDCPQVWVLRRYRDNVLDKNIFGKAFIRIYYATSPTLVKWFGKSSWFVDLWKPFLDRTIDKLREKGFSEEPYNDKY